MRMSTGWLGLVAVAALAACGDASGPGGGGSGTHPSLASIDSLPVGGNPYGIAISALGRTYVTLLDAGVVQDAALPVDAFGGPIGAGLLPPHVTFNPAGNRAYVVAQTGKRLTEIDVATSTVLDSLPLPADGYNLITSADGSEVFVSVSTGQVYIVDAGTFTVVDSIILPSAVNGFARHPSKDRIYISSRDGGEVVEVNAATHQILRSFPTGGMPQRLAVSPNGRELLIANETLGLDIWNLDSGTRDTTLAVPAYGLGLSPDGRKAYVTAGFNGVITVISRRTRTVDTTINVGGQARNVAFDPEGTTAVITNEDGFVTVVR